MGSQELAKAAGADFRRQGLAQNEREAFSKGKPNWQGDSGRIVWERFSLSLTLLLVDSSGWCPF